MKSSPGNLSTSPSCRRKETIIREESALSKAQCFIHKSAVLTVRRETQFIQLSEERVLSERENKRELMRRTVMSSNQLGPRWCGCSPSFNSSSSVHFHSTLNPFFLFLFSIVYMFKETWHNRPWCQLALNDISPHVSDVFIYIYIWTEEEGSWPF